MKSIPWKFVSVVTIACSFVLAPVVGAQSEEEADENAEPEEVVVLGSRNSKPRSVTDSPVPIDVISGADFNLVGGSADITDNLKALVPSYTATPATGDGSAFVRPTSLRGTAPDQTLVLVNGKRRHRSALVQFFAPAAGNGAHGPDVGMIPAIAIKRVEVLRDGAASQYGSDAIAGVINFAMKDASEGAEVQIQYGQHYDEEVSQKISANYGLALGERGFVNISAERIDNDALSRGVQRPDAQALEDAGVTGVGADSPFGDTPLAQTWGRPQSEGTRVFVNSGFDLAEDRRLYVHGNYAETEGRYRFFYRGPDHSSLDTLRAQGFTGLAAGYTPFLDGDQTDLSVITGLDGKFADGTNYDFSVAFGQNELDYFLNNTINPDLGLIDGSPAQRDFNVGGYEQEELNLSADFSRALTNALFLGFGTEWRKETYSAVAGEVASYTGAGSNGLKGISPSDAGDFERDNVAFYADLEHEVNDAAFLQYALRYEDFSDFGGTLNGKLAGRYRVNPSVAVRAAVSTGFHAPTPGQANVRTTITTFDGTTGLQVEEGLVPSTSPLVALVGGKALTEETAVNISAGFSASIGNNTNATVDFYKIDVSDRIYRTGDIAVPGTKSQTISFYTNALDVESVGLDLVVTSALDWNADVNTDLTLAFGFNEVEVVEQTKVGGVEPVSEAIIEDIENNYPNERAVLTANTKVGRNVNVLARVNYYGKHFDERGRIDADESPSAEIDATVYVDLELGSQITDNFHVALGAVNIFDTFIGEIEAPFSNRQSVGLQYPRRSAANYEGGAWYLRSTISF